MSGSIRQRAISEAHFQTQHGTLTQVTLHLERERAGQRGIDRQVLLTTVVTWAYCSPKCCIPCSLEKLLVIEDSDKKNAESS